MLDVRRCPAAGVFANREGALAPLPLFAAPKTRVALTKRHSGSDGDQFPYYFHAYGLGPVVGERTWGGVQGINGPWALMDGTVVTIPEDSLASLDGRWLIENEGPLPTSRWRPPSMRRRCSSSQASWARKRRAC